MTRQVITMINKRQLRTSVIILAILVVLGFVGMGMYRENESAYELVWSPISSVTEREDMFSLTVNVLDGNHLDELMRFSQLCADSKIPVCFFLSEKFYSVNSENAKKIASLHEVGLLIEKDTEYLSRGETLRLLANANEDFFKHVGKYPRYVRSTKKSLGLLTHILDAYGQYGIASVDPSATVSNGSIVDVGAIDTTTAPRVVALVTEAARHGLEATPLRDMLYSVDVKPDVFGVQHGNG